MMLPRVWSALQVALPEVEVSFAPFVLQANTWKYLQPLALYVQKVSCPKKQTVKYVNSVAQARTVKAAKQEILLVRRANSASTKLHLASAKIVHQDSTQMAKVRRAVQNVLLIPTWLHLVNRRNLTVKVAPWIVPLELRKVTLKIQNVSVNELNTTPVSMAIVFHVQSAQIVLSKMGWYWLSLPLNQGIGVLTSTAIPFHPAAKVIVD
jgi:hypothetical protein